MSNQGKSWEQEYRNPKLVTKNEGPQKDTLNFIKFLKKKEKFVLKDKTILDLGCGTGRNSNYLAEFGNNLIGIEISKTALALAKERAKNSNVLVDYRLGDIGIEYEIDANSVDVIFDVTSSNSLDERGREIYLKESARVLKSGGYMFVRALCKDGNANVKALLKNSPGEEYDTYYLKDLDLIERVFSKEDITKMYSQYFTILNLEKKTNYSKMNGRLYKRDYWLLYLQK